MKEFFIKHKIKKYTRSLTKSGDDPQLFGKLADLHVQLSQEDEACEYYERAIEAYYQHETRLGSENEFILTLCWKLLDLDPINEKAYNTLGQEFCGLSRFDDAAILYQRYAEKLARGGCYEQAITQYRNVLVICPEKIEVRQRLVVLLWRFRRREETVQELKKIAELAEKNGNVAKALECYKKAVKILPADSLLQAELRRIIQCTRQMKNPLRLVVNK